MAYIFQHLFIEISYFSEREKKEKKSYDVGCKEHSGENISACSAPFSGEKSIQPSVM